MTRMCKEFNCLPGPGGLMDQDSYTVFIMSIVTDAWQEREKLDADKREAEAKASR